MSLPRDIVAALVVSAALLAAACAESGGSSGLAGPSAPLADDGPSAPGALPPGERLPGVVQSVDCMPGSLGCWCDHRGACLPHPDGTTPVVCESGFCLVDQCPRGSESCPCYANGTCDPLDGVPMTCSNGSCEPTALPEPGLLGGPCGPTVECDDASHTDLICLAGLCQVPGCPLGAAGCACRPYGQCDGVFRCIDAVCALTGCEAGTLGCGCDVGDTCSDELSCVDDICRSPAPSIVVDGAGAAACEFVLSSSHPDGIGDVDFARGVVGASHGRKSRVGIAAVLSTGRVVAHLLAGAESASSYSVSDVQCVGPSGEVVRDVVVRVE